MLTVTNTGTRGHHQDADRRLADRDAASADGTELTGTVNARYNVTVVTPRLSGDGLTVSGTTLTPRASRSSRASRSP